MIEHKKAMNFKKIQHKVKNTKFQEDEMTRNEKQTNELKNRLKKTIVRCLWWTKMIETTKKKKRTF